MATSSTVSLVSIILGVITWGSLGFLILKSKFPGRGLKVIENIFKKTTSFEEALKALKEGKRIRRKTKRKGFTQITIIEGKNKIEKYGTYWVSSNDKDISDHCSFSIEDVLATDWITDE